MQDNTIGINDQGIDKIIIDITEYANSINKLLNQVDELVTETNDYFIGENGDSFRKKISEVQSNYHTINQNFLCYAKDLVNVKTKYKIGMQTAADDINGDLHNT